MNIIAQAAAEYGGLAARNTAANPLDQMLQRLTSASPLEYVFLAGGLLVAFMLLMKLLDAA